MVRLFDMQSQKKITCQDVCDLLNADRGNKFDESSYRKYYRAFEDGRRYELKQQNKEVMVKMLAISDLHFPYQLPKELFNEYVGMIDVLILNGDLLDMKEISKFERSYRQSPMDDIINGRDYIMSLIDYIHPKGVIVNYGNHDLRFQKYFSKHLDTDLVELMPMTPLELIFEDGFNHYDKESRSKVFYEPLSKAFDDIDIEYTGSWWCKVGKTIFAHPSAYSSSMLKTTEKAVNYFFRVESDFDTVVLAHTHKLGQYIQGGVHMFEQGAACYVDRMKYADGKLIIPSQRGALYLCQDKNGSLIYDHCKLIEL